MRQGRGIPVREREHLRQDPLQRPGEGRIPGPADVAPGESVDHGIADPDRRGPAGLGARRATYNGAAAGRLTAGLPFDACGRSDKKAQPRVPITARLIADMITVAGADRVLTMDLHQGQIQGFFNIPVDELTAVHLLSNYFIHKHLTDVVVVTDLGFAKRARTFAELLDPPLEIIEKRRVGNLDRAE